MGQPCGPLVPREEEGVPTEEVVYPEASGEVFIMDETRVGNPGPTVQPNPRVRNWRRHIFSLELRVGKSGRHCF